MFYSNNSARSFPRVPVLSWEPLFSWVSKFRVVNWVLVENMRAAVPMPAVAAASVLHSAAVGGSVVGDVGPL